MRTSASLSLAPGWSHRYARIGIPPDCTSSQMASSLSTAFGRLPLRSGAGQSEMFMCVRPSCTSSATSQEAGAMLLYQGQRVSVELDSQLPPLTFSGIGRRGRGTYLALMIKLTATKSKEIAQ